VAYELSKLVVPGTAPLAVPPLRERKEDIPLLIKWFYDELVRKMGKRAAEIPKRTMPMLQRYPWPGNVRELKHAVEGAMITARGKKLNFELPKIADAALSGFKSFEEMEREYILQVLEAKNWRIGVMTVRHRSWGCMSIRYAAA